MSLSVVINTKNSAMTLERTLKSVGFADEIIVVDMHSTDQTVDIAKKFGAKVFLYRDVGYVEPARNFAIEQAKGDWILIVDADEEVSDGLRLKIGQIIDKVSADEADCYYIPRQNIIFGKWIRKTGWWPDYVLRLFKKSHVEWSEVIHSVPITKGKVVEIPDSADLAIIHHNYQSVEQFIDRLNRYTSIEARKSDKKVVTAAEIVTEFKNELLRRLFAQGGIDEGIHGTGLAFLQTTYQLTTQLKMWQEDGFPEQKNQQQAVITELRQFQKELNYWIADWQLKHSRGWQRVYWRWRRRLFI